MTAEEACKALREVANQAGMTTEEFINEGQFVVLNWIRGIYERES